MSYPGAVTIVSVRVTHEGQRVTVTLSNGMSREYRVADIVTGTWRRWNKPQTTPNTAGRTRCAPEESRRPRPAPGPRTNRTGTKPCG